MACLENYNNNNSSDHHKGGGGDSPFSLPVPPLMSPRISFSNDFADSSSTLRHRHQAQQQTATGTSWSRDSPPVSSDFEFTVSEDSNSLQLTADELFFKGRILPFKDNNRSSISTNQQQITRTNTFTTTATAATTTLRDELLAGDDEDYDDLETSSTNVVGFCPKPPLNNKQAGGGRWKGLLSLRKSHIGSKKLLLSSDHSNNNKFDHHETANNNNNNANGFIFPLLVQADDHYSNKLPKSTILQGSSTGTSVSDPKHKGKG